MAGKGDDRRPSQVSEAELARNWERTFGRPEWQPPLSHLSPEGFILTDFAVSGLRKRCPDARS